MPVLNDTALGWNKLELFLFFDEEDLNGTGFLGVRQQVFLPDTW
jgi:hypothetical protein